LRKIEITGEGNDANYWVEVWKFRHLLTVLAWRDISVRYKQTLVGILWAVIRPALTIAIFWIIGTALNISSHGNPRFILIAAATISWQLVSSSFSDAANSVINNANLVTKVYFPPIILPLSSILVSIFDFLISLTILLIIVMIGGFGIGVHMLILPVFILLSISCALGSGLLFASLNVKYRDIRVIVPFMIQLGIYISPVAFNSASVFESNSISYFVKLLYSLNPMVAIIDGFKWCFTFGNFELNMPWFLISVGFNIIILILGIIHFRTSEKYFADII
jgi:lipopolysaccharide transport system permease protein